MVGLTQNSIVKSPFVTQWLGVVRGAAVTLATDFAAGESPDWFEIVNATLSPVQLDAAFPVGGGEPAQRARLVGGRAAPAPGDRQGDPADEEVEQAARRIPEPGAVLDRT